MLNSLKISVVSNTLKTIVFVIILKVPSITQDLYKKLKIEFLFYSTPKFFEATRFSTIKALFSYQNISKSKMTDENNSTGRVNFQEVSLLLLQPFYPSFLLQYLHQHLYNQIFYPTSVQFNLFQFFSYLLSFS